LVLPNFKGGHCEAIWSRAEAALWRRWRFGTSPIR